MTKYDGNQSHSETEWRCTFFPAAPFHLFKCPPDFLCSLFSSYVFPCFLGSKISKTIALVRQRHKIQLENYTICQSIQTRQKCQYEALLVNNFFLDLLHYVDSWFGTVFLLFHYKFTTVNRVLQKRTKSHRFQFSPSIVHR